MSGTLLSLISNGELAWLSGQRVGLAIQRSRIPSDHYLDVFHGSPEFKSSAKLVNNQLVCLRPVGILSNVMFNVNHLFELFAQPAAFACAINIAEGK